MDERQIRLSLLIGLMACTLAGVLVARRYKRLQAQQVHWERVPYGLGTWEGQDEHFNPLYGEDPADSSVLRIYRKSGSPPVTLYVGFHQDLPTGLEVHSPELCYPAQGWMVISERKSSLGEFRNAPLKVNEIMVSKAGEFRLVAWWYQCGSRAFEGRIRQVYRLMLMGMFTGRTDGSVVRLETPLRDGEDKEPAHGRILEFSKVFLPSLGKALPQ